MEPGNILKIDSLDEGWRDKDSVMLHACFQLLRDCVEKENLLGGDIDWEANDSHRLAREEIEDLYNWWHSYKEPDIPNEDIYKEETQMLLRLIKVRWALWT